MTAAEQKNCLRMQQRDSIRNCVGKYGLQSVRPYLQDGARMLEVKFLASALGVQDVAVPAGLSAANLLVVPGDSNPPALRVVSFSSEPGSSTASIELQLAEDTSESLNGLSYRLIIRGREDFPWPYSVAEFMFGSSAVARPAPPAKPAGAPSATPVDMMNKDYASFRGMMLESLARSVPEWRERHPADLGVVLVELLAYVADMLSYYQDAAATEAFLDTARLRTSIVRHAQLLGYRARPPVAPRTWVHFDVGSDLEVPQGTAVMTHQPGWQVVVKQSVVDQAQELSDSSTFETATDAQFYLEHNLIAPYDFGMPDFVLAAGSTGATLVGNLPKLVRGTVLAFEAMPMQQGQQTWRSHMVRLASDSVVRQDATGQDLTEVRWFDEDSLPQDFPVRSAGVATWVRANMVPVDAGKSRTGLLLAPVLNAGRYRPYAVPNVIWTVPYDEPLESRRPAAQSLEVPAEKASAAIKLVEQTLQQATWVPTQSLLDQQRFTRCFVVESEESQPDRLRFGNGENGRRPSPSVPLVMTVRAGKLESVGALAIAHVVEPEERSGFMPVLAIHNPLAVVAQPQDPTERIRILAPSYVRDQQTAILPADYVSRVTQHGSVLAAAARQQGAGLERRMSVSVQLQPGLKWNAALRQELQDLLGPALPFGSRIALGPARRVPLQIWILVTVSGPAFLERDLISTQVEGEVRKLFAEGNFMFGQAVAQSQVIAAVMRVRGVQDTALLRFCASGESSKDGLLQQRVAPDPYSVLLLAAEDVLPESLKVLVKDGRHGH